MTETLVPQVETAPQKRLFIKTYGCQMNVYDSERMADVLRPLGYGVTDDVKAGIVVATLGYWRQLNEGTVNSISSAAFTDMGHAPSFSDNLVEVSHAN